VPRTFTPTGLQYLIRAVTASLARLDDAPTAIYGSHMTTKTTVYLDSTDYRRLKAIARVQGRPPAALIRDAVAEYARHHGRSKVPRSLGVGHSGRRDLGERSEELLKGMGRPR